MKEKCPSFKHRPLKTSYLAILKLNKAPGALTRGNRVVLQQLFVYQFDPLLHIFLLFIILFIYLIFIILFFVPNSFKMSLILILVLFHWVFKKRKERKENKATTRIIRTIIIPRGKQIITPWYKNTGLASSGEWQCLMCRWSSLVFVYGLPKEGVLIKTLMVVAPYHRYPQKE